MPLSILWVGEDWGGGGVTAVTKLTRKFKSLDGFGGRCLSFLSCKTWSYICQIFGIKHSETRKKKQIHSTNNEIQAANENEQKMKEALGEGEGD